MTRSRLFDTILREHDDDVDTRAAVVIKKKGTNKVLGCRGWGKRLGDDGEIEAILDLPKGHLRKGEDLQRGAAREALEETGIKVGQLMEIGQFDYGRKGRTLTVYYAEESFDINELKCTSTFENVYGQTVPEMVGYHLVDVGDLAPWFKSLRPIMRQCYEWMEENAE